MNKVILHIKDADNVFQQVDLFKDETISVTSKIQDIRDISKVFTDFSQSFTLPASKKNNKIFKHFYNYFISEGAFDARKKVEAVLEINYIPFRRGKIFLNSVKMKNNKAYSYNVTFFGNTVSLKDLFGDDELESLTWLNNFTHDWNHTEVYSGFIYGKSFTVDGETKTDAIIYPLITPEKRLYFDSSNNDSNTLSGNLNYQSGGGTHAIGLRYTDLKPAIDLAFVIEAIEKKYGIEFTTDFFKDTKGSGAFRGTLSSNNGLFMWLSREKGVIGSSSENAENILNGFTYTSGYALANMIPNNTFYLSDSGDLTDSIINVTKMGIPGEIPPKHNRWIFTLNISTSSTYKYKVEMFDENNNNELLQTFDNQEGSQSLVFNLGTENRSYGIKFVLTSNTGFVATSTLEIKEEIRQNRGNVLVDTYTGVYTPSSITPVLQIIPTERVPKMKVYDFMSGLFKLFNLTAYYVDNENEADFGKIRVLPLDEFYDDNPKIFDITKYVDSSNTDIESTIPYSEIEFKYQEPKTLLMLKHKEEFNEIFGDTTYKSDDVDRGKPYKVEVPFEHLKYERLFDDDTGDTTEIMWGYSAGNNFKPDAGTDPPSANYDSVLTKPILFYGRAFTLTSSDYISWMNGSTHTYATRYWMPANAVERGTSQTNPLRSGLNNSSSSFRLYDIGGDFVPSVKPNDIVFNTTDTLFAKVVSVIDDDTLELDNDIFPAGTSGKIYIIYRPPTFTLNFDAEIDEYTRDDYGSDTNSLFNVFYRTYIEDAFNAKKRIFKLTAHLPNSVLLNYELKDRFQIGDKVFTINSIDTNLKTGESKLELLNVL
jgi:hypothetical protein